MNRKSLFYSPFFWLLCIALLFLVLWVFFGSSIIGDSGTIIDNTDTTMKIPFNINYQKRNIIEHVNKAVSNAAQQGYLPAGAAYIDRYRNDFIKLANPVQSNFLNATDDTTKFTQQPTRNEKPIFVPTAPGQGGLVPLNGACSKGELICKQTAERCYGKEFIRVRPPWLINPITGQPLELDVYNDELKIAIEYNGEQHYNEDHPFHKGNKQNFYDMVYRDEEKKRQCAKYGIDLIIVSYKVPHIKIPPYLRARLPRR